MPAFKVLYRVVIMAGTLGVAGLGYVAYGPELQELKPVVDRLKEAAMGLLESKTDPPADPLAGEGSLTPFPASVDLQVMPSAPPRIDSRVEPAILEVAEPSVAQIVRRLEQLGVAEYSLTPWGTEGEYYRFECSAPWGAGGAFSRQFEAVASDPVAAAQQVLEQVASEGSSVERRASREQSTDSGPRLWTLDSGPHAQ